MFEPPDFFFIEDPKGVEVAEKVYITVGLYGEEFVEVVDGALNPGDDVSTTYEAAAKKTTTQGSGMGGGRRMGGPPM